MTSKVLISFISLDSSIPDFNKKIIKKWVNKIILSYHKKIGEITYHFCSTQKIIELNKFYFKRDIPTDIIAIDQVVENIISGELFICSEVIKKNALIYKTNYYNELYRVLIHGILHLVGFSDKSISEKKSMIEAENKAIDLLKNFLNHKI